MDSKALAASGAQAPVVSTTIGKKNTYWAAQASAVSKMPSLVLSVRRRSQSDPRRSKDVQPLRRRDGEVKGSRTTMERREKHISRSSAGMVHFIRLLGQQEARSFFLRTKSRRPLWRKARSPPAEHIPE